MRSFYFGLTFSAIMAFLSGQARTQTTFSYFIKTSGNRPYGIAFDGRGAMYMVTAPETGDGTLSLVTPDGKVTNLATLAGTFIGPGLTVDESGNALVAVGDKLLKVTHDGTITTIADGFRRCLDVKLDRSGNIYVADDGKKVIYKIMPEGEKKIFYSSNDTDNLALSAICIDHDQNNLYVRDGNKLLRVSLDSKAIPQKADLVLEYSGMFYMCLDSNNNIYVSTLSNVIEIDSADNTKILSSTNLNTAIGLATGGDGFNKQIVYVTVGDGIIELSMTGRPKN